MTKHINIMSFWCLIAVFATSVDQIAFAAEAKEAKPETVSTVFAAKKNWVAQWKTIVRSESLAGTATTDAFHYLSAKYRFGNWSAGAVAVGESRFGAGEESLRLLSPQLRLTRAKIIKTSSLKVALQVRAMPAIRDSSDNHAWFQARLYAYQTPGPGLYILHFLRPSWYWQKEGVNGKFTIGSYHEFGWNLTDQLIGNVILLPTYSILSGQDNRFNDLPVQMGFTVRLPYRWQTKLYVESPLFGLRSENTRVLLTLQKRII